MRSRLERDRVRLNNRRRDSRSQTKSAIDAKSVLHLNRSRSSRLLRASRRRILRGFEEGGLAGDLLPLYQPALRATQRKGRQAEGSRSFLKRRTKKLLPIKGSTRLAHLNRQLGTKSKSFLFLFFKKEILVRWCISFYAGWY
jgi:hypothetical protein